MKKLVLALTVVLVLSGIFAVAALSEVSLERDITVSIATDMDSNVAIFFEDGDKYSGVLDLQDDGTVNINLAGGHFGNFNHFNNDALFVIGEEEAGNGVFKITNHAPGPIEITINIANNYLEIRDSSGDTDTVTLTSGETEEFHFALDTRDNPIAAINEDDSHTLTGTLVITTP